MRYKNYLNRSYESWSFFLTQKGFRIFWLNFSRSLTFQKLSLKRSEKLENREKGKWRHHKNQIWENFQNLQAIAKEEWIKLKPRHKQILKSRLKRLVKFAIPLSYLNLTLFCRKERFPLHLPRFQKCRARVIVLAHKGFRI